MAHFSNIVESPNNGHIGAWLLSVVERCPLLEMLNYYMYGKLIHSVLRGLSVVEELSDFRSIRFGRLYCSSRGDY